MEKLHYKRADLIKLALAKYTNEDEELNIFSLIKRKRDIKTVSTSIILKSKNTDPVFFENHQKILEGVLNYCINNNLRTNKDLSNFLKLSRSEMLEKIKNEKECEELKNILSTNQGEIFLSSARTSFEAIHSIASSTTAL